MNKSLPEFDWLQIVRPSGRLISSAELMQFEEALTFTLPEDYRSFLLAINGGKISIEHEFHVPQLDCDTFVNYLLPLTVESPFIGIKECRDIQVANRLGIRQALQIGHNMGTGFFFLILDGAERGAVYFSFKDDLPMLEGDWFIPQLKIPKGMAKISPTFTALGQTIILNQMRE